MQQKNTCVSQCKKLQHWIENVSIDITKQDILFQFHTLSSSSAMSRSALIHSFHLSLSAVCIEIDNYRIASHHHRRLAKSISLLNTLNISRLLHLNKLSTLSLLSFSLYKAVKVHINFPCCAHTSYSSTILQSALHPHPLLHRKDVYSFCHRAAVSSSCVYMSLTVRREDFIPPTICMKHCQGAESWVCSLSRNFNMCESVVCKALRAEQH